MNERNPISIDAGKRKRAETKSSTKHRSSDREKTPPSVKGAGKSRSTTANKTGRTTTSKNKPAAGDAVNTASLSAQDSSSSVSAAPSLPENHHPGLHERSYAAHLDAGPRGPHTKPAGDLRFTAPFPTGRKQP